MPFSGRPMADGSLKTRDSDLPLGQICRFSHCDSRSPKGFCRVPCACCFLPRVSVGGLRSESKQDVQGEGER